MAKAKVVSMNKTTPMQSGMLFHSLLHEESSVYYGQTCLYLEGMINNEVLKKAWQEVVNRHEIFRTDFRWKETKHTIQIVLSEKEAEIYEYDLSIQTQDVQTKEIEEIKARDLTKPFSFEQGKLNRLSIIKLAETRYYLCWNFHHILLDGWSVPLVFRDFVQIYQRLANGQPLPPKPSAQFSDYLLWLKKQDIDKARSFWQLYLSDLAEPTPLPPLKRMLKTEEPPTSHVVLFSLSEEMSQAMGDFSQTHRVTINAILQTSWGILLQKYNNRDTSCFGMTVSGRPATIPGVEEIVGLFINTLPVVIHTRTDQSLRSLVKEVNSALVQMRDYEFISLADVQNWSDLDGDLFNTIVVFENYPVDASGINQEESDFIIRMDSSFELTNYDLTVVFAGQEKIIVKFLYNPQVFCPAEMDRIRKSFLIIVETIISQPDLLVEQMAIVGKAELEQIYSRSAGEQLEYPADMTVDKLIEEQVCRTPENVAVVCNEAHWTYRELNERANTIAQHLRKRGVQSGEIVGILVGQNLNMFSGILGILKAGGAYLPIDPANPWERIAYMLQDSQTRVLLVQESLLEHLQEQGTFHGQCLVLQEQGELYWQGEPVEMTLVNLEKQLAYVIYTSGSTGKPKGVMIAHSSLINLMIWHNQFYRVTAADKATKYAGFAFDASVWEIFPYLAAGTEIHLISEEIRLDLVKLNQYYTTQGITISFLPTQLAEQFMELENHSLTRLLTGGDRLKSYISRPYQIFNNYGPTENTVVTTVQSVEQAENPIPIGRPIANTKIYILDRNLNFQPWGVPGELCISGVGLALGYLGQPELTAEKFITHPLMPGKRLYRTGDLARWREDGSLEFLGRIDTQVKIRGFRIELGEIETELQHLPGIKAAAVQNYLDSGGNSYLVAYLVSEETITPSEIRAALARHLPEYMIPAQYIYLDSLPLTSNGKVNRVALPEPTEVGSTGTKYAAPCSDIEIKLAELWSEILGVPKIGIDDHFFELGGHSLKATSLAARVGKELGIELPLKQIFTEPTIRSLAAYLTGAAKNSLPPIEAVEEREYYPVSSAQRRIYILEQFEGVGISYNMPMVFQAEGRLDIDRLTKAYHTLLYHHESLRTSFYFLDGEPVQKVHPVVEGSIEYRVGVVDEKTILPELIRPFALNQAPLCRLTVLQIAEERHVLVFDTHHIISDGTSMAILYDELIKLYNGEELTPLKIQYKDYAVWQQRALRSERVKEQETILLKEFSGELPVLNLPTDNPRPAVFSHEGAVHTLTLDRELSDHLSVLAKNQNVTLYMVLLGIFSTVLSRYTGQEDILIGTVTAGRTQTDLEPLVGLFLNNIIFRCQPVKNQSFTQYLEMIKEKVVMAYENQDYPVEELIARLNPPFDLSRNALFDVMFILQNFTTPKTSAKLGHVTLSPYPTEQTSAKYDLTVYASEGENGIQLGIEYSTRLFRSDTIARFGGHLRQIASEIVLNPTEQIGKLRMLTPTEEAEILFYFNQTEQPYAKDQMVHELFESQVKQTPEKIALISCGQEMTYHQLNRQANRLAKRLRELGIRTDQIVGIMAERSPEMVICILAVLKAGGAYLPLDPDYPSEHLSYILQDSRASLLLIQRQLTGRVEFTGTTIWLTGQLISNRLQEKSYLTQYNDTDSTGYAIQVDQGCDNLENHSHLTDLAYIIYTSGSTGKPKGVMVEIGNLLTYIHAFQQEFALDENDVVLQQASYSFDAFVEEFYPVLLVGGTVIIPDRFTIADPIQLHYSLQQYQVTLLSCSPLLLNELNQLPPVKSLRKLISGGDVLKEEYISHLIGSVQVYNTYGPTEATVCATYYSCPNPAPTLVPIGKPISNYRVYILDSGDQLLPVGIPGELCIAGDGVTRGYLYRPELTAERFIPDPYQPGSRMYKTGDLARWLPDGNLEYLGRLDTQVKIRGYRIEPGEIESQLLHQESVTEAVVITRDEGGEKYLCAYLVIADKGHFPTIEELRTELAKSLPAYMIPGNFVFLDRLPQTSNGKIDRRALPAPEGHLHLSTSYVAPTNALETSLVNIWCQVLGQERIGIKDHFFTLGGHSLKATAMAAQVKKELGIELPLRQIFNLPTIEELAQYLALETTGTFKEIPLAEKQDDYPVSSAQKRMYILHQLTPESTNYNLPHAMLIEGSIDREHLNAVFHTLVQRHESFRTSFFLRNGEVVQRVHDTVDFAVEWSSREGSGDWQQMIQDSIQPFVLGHAPLLRVKVIQSAEKHLLFFDLHHIIADGFSVDLLVSEFLHLYEGYSLPEPRIQYKDFTVWQNSRLTNVEMQKQEAYWLEILSGELPVLNLLTDYPRPAVQSFTGNTYDFTLEPGLSQQLYDLARDQDATLFMILLAAYSVLLARYTGQDDLLIGSPIAGRHYADLQKIIGMFVNTLVYRNRPQGEKTFQQFLTEVKEQALNAYEHQDYPFEFLVEKLNLARDLSRNPLFDTIFTLQNMNLAETVKHTITFQPVEFADSTANFDLSLFAFETVGGIHFSLQYGRSLFNPETIILFCQHFVQLLQVLAENPDISLASVDFLTEEEKYQLLYRFNDTNVSYYHEKVIHQIFAEQVERTPDHLAAVWESEQITFQDLHTRSNRLARKMRAKGVGPESVVGILFERNIDMLVGVLAIVKAGGAYLPIDPNLPVSRIQYMLADSGADLLLDGIQSDSQSKDLLSLLGYTGDIVRLTDDNLYFGDDGNVPNISQPTDLIYIIYTSGSTGKPKGVMIEHWNVNRLLSDPELIDLTENDHFLQTASLAFDVSTFEIWATLCRGATLYLIGRDDLLSAKALAQKIQEYGITYIWMNTALFSQLIEEDTEFLRGVRTLAVGGETLQPQFPNLALADHPGLQIMNCYGPTESTTFATYHRIDHPCVGSVPIGKPMANTQVYILDSTGRLQPSGVPGELCIGGDGLARGYVNLPELTAEKFVSNPHIQGKRMYRSGDLAKWQPDGTIEFLGRMDQQVKIRGYRVELGEVTNSLLQHSAIKEAVVIHHTSENRGSYLAAYFVAEKELCTPELREHMALHLPDYMIPAYFTQMPKLPLTANDKIDQRALPVPTEHLNRGREVVEPANRLEEQLRTLWQEILGIPAPGVTDNFFELGGHSLKATTLVSRIYKEFQVDLPLRQIFQTPTIRGLANSLTHAKQHTYLAIQPVAPARYYATSSAQKRMYVLQQLDLTSTVYNMPGFLSVEGNIDRERFMASFQALIRRHESFRTSFAVVENELVQFIQPSVPFALDEREGREEDLPAIMAQFVQPFELSKAPLLRVGLVKTPTGFLLMFDLHHIIADGVSLQIMLQNFLHLYAGENIPDLRIQYKDFALWQNALLTSEVIQKEETFWLQRFAGEIPVLHLPTDYPRPAVVSFAGDSFDFMIPADLSLQLRELADQEGATLYMILLAAYNLLLTKYTGQDDLIIGSPIAGRPHPDLDEIIGMFVNTLAMRNQPEQDKTFRQFLTEVKENALLAYEHQNYPFEMLVEKLQLERNLSRNALIDTMFIQQNLDNQAKEIPGSLQLKPYPFANQIAKFDLSLTLVEVENTFGATFEYRTELFTRATVALMSTHFVRILEQFTTNPEIQLGRVEILSPEERLQILQEFNRTTVDGPSDKTLHLLFEEQVQLRPDATAFSSGDQHWTYQELNYRSNQIAHFLRRKGVQPNEIVAILAQPSFETGASLFGILKAGAAYLPLLPQMPRERVMTMLQDSGTRFLLSQEPVPELEFTGEIIEIAKISGDPQQPNPLPITQPTDLAYVIYTSGTTGKPKGVLIEHRGVVNTLQWRMSALQVCPSDRSLQLLPFTFDGFVLSFYTPLIAGAEVIFLGEEEIKDPLVIKERIQQHQVTILMMIPSMYQSLLAYVTSEDLSTLRIVTLGAERVSADLVRLHHQINSGAILVNEYGPTENSVISTAEIGLMPGDKITIGRPIWNTQVYILDQNLLPVPTGVPGEIYLSGIGLARGYLHRPELTAERFTSNPFSSGETMYRTGDLARWLPDGRIDFLGRVDDQVKIRGFRIELGEIDNCLQKHPQVKEAVVIDMEDTASGKYLAGYYVIHESESVLSSSELKEFIAKELPEYMIPTYLIPLDHLPRTTNGKVDRKKLPTPARSVESGVPYQAPTNPIEEKLVEIWSELLNLELIGIDDHFFTLGGHSIRATLLAARINKEFNIRLPLQEIFRTPTIRSLAQYIQQGRAHEITVPHTKLHLPVDEIVRSIPQTDWQNLQIYADSCSARRVLLTGVTGFLGIHLLEELLNETEVEIYCLIRGRDTDDATRRLQEMLHFYFAGSYTDLVGTRVHPLRGDITKPYFGFTREEYAHLGETVDMVLHAAALVKHFGEEDQFLHTNIHGTREVIRFAETHQCRLYHVSTVSVSGTRVEGEGEILFTENDFYIGQNDQDNPYVKSKFLAENLVFQAMQRGLQATIFRVGNLTGRHRDGQFQLNVEENAFHSQLKTMIEFRVVAEEMLHHILELTPVDLCCKAMVAVMQASPMNHIFHVYNTKIISLQEMMQTLNSLGIGVRSIDSDRIHQHIEEVLQDPEKSELMTLTLVHLQAAPTSSHTAGVIPDAKVTEMYLNQLGFTWPTIEVEYLQKVLNYLRKIGYLQG